MKLQDRIQNDIKTCMLSKEVEKLSLLRVIKGEINRIAKELPDEDIVKILRKMKENAELLHNEGEVKIINEYLPTTLGEIQLTSIVSGIIQKGEYSGIQDMGKVMTELRNYGSVIDIKLASGIAKKLLSI